MLLAFPLQAPPDPRIAFVVALIAVVAVALFAAGLVMVLLRRSYFRRMEEEKLVAMGRTVARILHQVKNPLQTVMLQAELLQDSAFADDAASRQESCEVIVSEAERVALMLNELSLWASGSRRALRREPTPLHDLVHGLIRTQSQEAGEQGVQLRAGHVAEATVLADVYYLQQAVENLIRNAREAVAGRGDSRVIVDLEHTGRTATIRVADNGPGIPYERLGEIFQPFVSSKSKGMGLGLPICREIVEEHAGRLEVESRLGSGTAFHIVLPLYDGESPPSLVGRRKH